MPGAALSWPYLDGAPLGQPWPSRVRAALPSRHRGHWLSPSARIAIPNSAGVPPHANGCNAALRRHALKAEERQGQQGANTGPSIDRPMAAEFVW